MMVAAAALALALGVPGAAAAQETNFLPIMLAFDGKEALGYPASSALDVEGAGTIEAWIRAGWTGNAGYDPAILSYQGASGARLALLLSGDAKALGVHAGQFYDKVAFDFSDGELHHVALILLGKQTMVMIDGEVRETLGFGMADLPATEFDIGSLGGDSPFRGEIGQVRVWRQPLDPATIAAWAWRPLASDGPDPHPDIAALAAASAFGNPETGGFIFFTPTPDGGSSAPTEPVDDSDLRPVDTAAAPAQPQQPPQ